MIEEDKYLIKLKLAKQELLKLDSFKLLMKEMLYNSFSVDCPLGALNTNETIYYHAQRDTIFLLRNMFTRQELNTIYEVEND